MGGLTLIKASFFNLPLYFLSIFKTPKKVALQIEAIFRRILWSGNEDRRKISLVKWGKLLRSKSFEGLGIKFVLYKNAGLLFKWFWRLVSDSDTQCSSLILTIIIVPDGTQTYPFSYVTYLARHSSQHIL